MEDPPTPQIKPFLRPVVNHTKRSKKSEEHGRGDFYLCPALNYPSGTCRVRDLETGTVVIMRDVSWKAPVFFPQFRVAYTLALEAPLEAPATEQGGNVRIYSSEMEALQSYQRLGY